MKRIYVKRIETAVPLALLAHLRKVWRYPCKERMSEPYPSAQMLQDR